MSLGCLGLERCRRSRGSVLRSQEMHFNVIRQMSMKALHLGPRTAPARTPGRRRKPLRRKLIAEIYAVEDK